MPSPTKSLTDKERVMAILDGLNPSQEDAVTDLDGPLLIIAGAGTGKTNVITRRIAMLIANGVDPYNILAVTFTTKAAEEMRRRIKKLLPGVKRTPVACTFHSLGVKILRDHAEAIGDGRDRNFSIYDEECNRVIKGILKEMELEVKQFPPADVKARISAQKNKGRGPDHPYCFDFLPADSIERRTLLEIYKAYEKAFVTNNAFDFDDLLMRPTRLLRQNPEIRAEYHEQFPHVSVDEYQDTNQIQANLINLMALGPHAEDGRLPEGFWVERSLAVCGDDAQSIYRFRGSEIDLIRSFERNYNAAVVTLNLNYRSTSPILTAANRAIERAGTGFKKELKSAAGEGGAPVRIRSSRSGVDEAKRIAPEIVGRLKNPEATVGILYRTTMQGRLFEEALRNAKIPYSLTGGVSFYERAEIKDVLAYLKIAKNPQDDQSLARILNVPKRGVGAATIEQGLAAAALRDMSLSALLDAGERPEEMKAAAWKKLEAAYAAIKGFVAKIQGNKLSEGLRAGLNEIGYEKYLKEEYEEDWGLRWENVAELVSAAESHDDGEDPLTEFLDVALLSTSERRTDPDVRVHLSTIHGAKGLEYDVVYLVGCETDLLPHANAQEPEEIEEELRLFYVALTRARKELFLSHAKTRTIYGSPRAATPSPFLEYIKQPAAPSAELPTKS